MLLPVFKSRSFGSILQPTLRFQVDSCTYSDQGGPRAARLYARPAGSPDLDQLISLLRCPIELYTPSGQAAWWGFVNAFTVQDGALALTVSLDDLANRVQVAYADMPAAASGAGVRQTTPWADDLASQAVFGIKEQQLSLAFASASQAAALRDQHLAACTRPALRASAGKIASARTGAGPYGRLITLDCRGWWDTLAWRYYSASPLAIENVNQAPTWEWDFGYSGYAEQVAQRVTIPAPGWFAGVVWLPLRRTTAVASNVVLDLCTDSFGAPGTVLSTAVYAGSSLTTRNFSWIKFIFSPGVALTAGSCWLILSDSAPYHGTHYRVLMDKGLHYAGGQALLWNGAAWISLPPDADLQFRLACILETTEQIRAMVSSAGQFLTGLRLEAASGLYTNPSRAGDSTALAEITRHLQAGTAGGQPLTAAVTAERALVIKSKAGPQDGPALKIGRDGIIRLPGGAPALPGPNLAGAWAACDAPWSATTASWGLAAESIYLNAVAWQADTGCVHP